MVLRVGILCGVFVALAIWGSGCEPATSLEKVATESTSEAVSKEDNVAAEKVTGADEPAPVSDTADAATESPPESRAESSTESRPESLGEGQPTEQPYTIVLFDRKVIHSTGSVDVRDVFSKFRFRNQSFAKLVLYVELESPCYPFEKWATPPAGHRWPANCDAFDRNMDVIWNPAKKSDDPPGFDLIRIITPFGGPLKTAANLVDLGNALAKKYPMDHEHEMKIHITTYSDGKGQVSGSAGTWIVSARLEVTPGPPPRNVLAAYPLFNHSYKHNDAKIESAEFTLPEGTTFTELLFKTTGHGGGAVDSSCIGPADEFCKRTHRLFADGNQFFQWIPWRMDCAKYCTETPHPRNPSARYCLENPCGDLRSVRASRANWCPGAVTDPLFQKPPALQTPGKHTFGYQITNVGKGGSWRVSAILYAYGD